MEAMHTIKITIKGGKVILVWKSAAEAQDFVDQVVVHGFLDPASASYYPPASILKIEAETAQPERTFSEP